MGAYHGVEGAGGEAVPLRGDGLEHAEGLGGGALHELADGGVEGEEGVVDPLRQPALRRTQGRVVVALSALVPDQGLHPQPSPTHSTASAG